MTAAKFDHVDVVSRRAAAAEVQPARHAGFAQSFVSQSSQRGGNQVCVGRSGDSNLNVNDGFGCESRHRSAADVLDGGGSESAAKCVGLCGKQSGPLRAGFNNFYRLINAGPAMAYELHAGSLANMRRSATWDPSRLPEHIRSRVEVVQGSHSDPNVVDEAFKGAETLFWVCPPDPRSESVEKAYLDFARPACEAVGKHGVQRVVSVSAPGRGTELAKHAGYVTASLAMDDLLASTGAHFRALTMPSFMDNLLRQVEPIRTQGVFFSPICQPDQERLLGSDGAGDGGHDVGERSRPRQRGATDTRVDDAHDFPPMVRGSIETRCTKRRCSCLTASNPQPSDSERAS